LTNSREQRLSRSPGVQRLPRPVIVRAANYEGSDHWVHPASLIHDDGQLQVTRTETGTEIKTETGIYVSPYKTNAHYWHERWFNVIRLEVPEQGLYGYYCNIAQPLPFDGETIRYVDLQLDVIVRAVEGGRLTHWLADEDEFEAAREQFSYAPKLIERCYDAVDELVALIESRSFPFERGSVLR
jgi:protein associated with RNAse G/E